MLLALGQCGAMCTNPPTPVGSSGIETSDMFVTYEAVPDGQTLKLSAEAKVAAEDSADHVALEGDDHFFVKVGDTTLELARVGEGAGVAYETTTAIPAIGTPIEFSLRRASKPSAPVSRVLFSKPFTISSHTPDALTPTTTSMLVHTDGIDGRTVEATLDACTNDVSSFSRLTAANAIQVDIRYGDVARPANCEATLMIDVIDRGDLDPALARGGVVRVVRKQTTKLPMVR
jgi:hypothetical protein